MPRKRPLFGLKGTELLAHGRTVSPSQRPKLPSIAPKPIVDIKHIRQNPDLYAENAFRRKYKDAAESPFKIIRLFDKWKELQRAGRGLREQQNAIRTKLSHAKTFSGRDVGDQGKEAVGSDALQLEGKRLKEQIAGFKARGGQLNTQIQTLATHLPNLTSHKTPMSEEPELVGYINGPPPEAISSHDRIWRNHVHLGTEFDLIDFRKAGTTTGWGWYFLKDEAARLEHALVQFALEIANNHGFREMSPPSTVYNHIGSACGFRPRDKSNEQQIYEIAQSQKEEQAGSPGRSLTGTAEIPFAAMEANTTFHESDLPIRVIGPSRCWRAEAGARGAETKGLYRVHEFTKVEMFAWGMKDAALMLFDEMLAVQHEILSALGLHCRILEMPASDLGASAYRKRDIEAYFPSRSERNQGWGEVTSTSMCTDYQTRRLSTRVRVKDGSLEFPETVNGTAMAVPRILAALLENGWNECEQVIKIPTCLWPWMRGNTEIKKKSRSSPTF